MPSKYELFPTSPSHTLALPCPRPASPVPHLFLTRSSPVPRPGSPAPCPALAHPRFRQSSRQNGQKRTLLAQEQTTAICRRERGNFVLSAPTQFETSRFCYEASPAKIAPTNFTHKFFCLNFYRTFVETPKQS